MAPQPDLEPGQHVSRHPGGAAVGELPEVMHRAPDHSAGPTPAEAAVRGRQGVVDANVAADAPADVVADGHAHRGDPRNGAALPASEAAPAQAYGDLSGDGTEMMKADSASGARADAAEGAGWASGPAPDAWNMDMNFDDRRAIGGSHVGSGELWPGADLLAQEAPEGPWLSLGGLGAVAGVGTGAMWDAPMDGGDGDWGSGLGRRVEMETLDQDPGPSREHWGAEAEGDGQAGQGGRSQGEEGRGRSKRRIKPPRRFVEDEEDDGRPRKRQRMRLVMVERPMTMADVTQRLAGVQCRARFDGQWHDVLFKRIRPSKGTWTVVVLSEDGEEEVAEDKDVSIQAMVEAGDVMVTVPTYEPVQGEGSTESKDAGEGDSTAVSAPRGPRGTAASKGPKRRGKRATAKQQGPRRPARLQAKLPQGDQFTSGSEYTESDSEGSSGSDASSPGTSDESSTSSSGSDGDEPRERVRKPTLAELKARRQAGEGRAAKAGPADKAGPEEGRDAILARILKRAQEQADGPNSPSGARAGGGPPAAAVVEKLRKGAASKLGECLAMAVHALRGEGARVGDAGKLGVEIEEALFKRHGEAMTDGYKQHFRSVHSNLKDPRNPDLRARVVLFEITPAQLVAMSSDELASKTVSEWRQRQLEAADKQRVLPAQAIERILGVKLDPAPMVAEAPDAPKSTPEQDAAPEGVEEGPREDAEPQSTHAEAAPSAATTPRGVAGTPRDGGDGGFAKPEGVMAEEEAGDVGPSEAATQGSSGIRETRFSTGIDWAALRARAATSAAAAADDAEGPESPDEDLALPEEPGRRGAEATGSPAAHREARPPAAAAHAPGFRGHAHGGGKERVDLSNLCVPGTAQHRAVLWHGSLDVSGLGSAQVQARELAGQGPLSAMLGQPGGTLNVGRLLDEGKTAKFFAEMRRSRSRTCTVGVVEPAPGQDGARDMLTQAARAWAKSGRPQVAFGEPSKGIELYLVPPGPLAAALLATAAQAAPDSNGPRVPPAGTLVAVLVHRKDFAPPEWWNKEAPGAAHAGPVPPSSGPTPSASLPPVPSAATLRAPHDPRRAGLPSAAAGQAQSDAALPALTSGNTLAMLQAALLGPAPPTSGPHPPAPVGGASMGSTGLNGNGVSAGAWQRGTPAQDGFQAPPPYPPMQPDRDPRVAMRGGQGPRGDGGLDPPPHPSSVPGAAFLGGPPPHTQDVAMPHPPQVGVPRPPPRHPLTNGAPPAPPPRPPPAAPPMPDLPDDLDLQLAELARSVSGAYRGSDAMGMDAGTGPGHRGDGGYRGRGDRGRGRGRGRRGRGESFYDDRGDGGRGGQGRGRGRWGEGGGGGEGRGRGQRGSWRGRG